MRPLLLGIVAIFVVTLGCERRSYHPNAYAACEEGGPLYNTLVDPENCGGCGVRCEAGVPCDGGRCQYNTPLHCGEPYRQCVAPDGKWVECVEHYAGDEASAPVDGFSCVPIEPRQSSPSDAAPESEAPPVLPDQVSVDVATPQWVGIPGASSQCMDDVDGRLCQTASVEFVDLCGSDVVQPLAYDFEIMTTEVSRAQYREARCDCDDVQTTLCGDVCSDLWADDRSEREVRPVTRVNWCQAYEVCRALGGRLPTVRERARLEALAYGSRSLFRQNTNCNAWIRETGAAPWVAECFDEPIRALALDRVDGVDGAVLLGVGVLLEPLLVYHLLGNIEEWLADPADALTTGALMDGALWGVSDGDDERRRPRVARGRSLHSPAGQPGSRLLVLEPSVRADDLGVRCARTSRSLNLEDVPYDAEPGSGAHAFCSQERPGLRPVRRMNGQRVFRASDVCFGGRSTDHDVVRLLEGRLEALLVQDQVALARLTQVDGELVGLGLARFSIDEQWWMTEPIEEPGASLALANDDGRIDLTWADESQDVSDACRAEMVDSTRAATDGHLLRVVEFTVDVDDIIRLNRASQADPAEFACAHLDCDDRLEDDEACVDGCTRWSLPLTIAFERVEPFDRAEMCAASVLNPAER